MAVLCLTACIILRKLLHNCAWWLSLTFNARLITDNGNQVLDNIFIPVVLCFYPTDLFYLFVGFTLKFMKTL